MTLKSRLLQLLSVLSLASFVLSKEDEFEVILYQTETDIRNPVIIEKAAIHIRNSGQKEAAQFQQYLPVDRLEFLSRVQVQDSYGANLPFDISDKTFEISGQFYKRLVITPKETLAPKAELKL
jgi:hypothetical protein